MPYAPCSIATEVPHRMTLSIDALTLRQRIAQMLLLGFRGCHAAECSAVLRDIRDPGVGGVILFDRDVSDPTLPRRNIESPEQVRALLADLQAAAPIPLLTAIDQEGGQVNRLKAAYGFPESRSHAELGRQDDSAASYREAALIARTLAAAGFNFNLAPVVDLDANPRNPIIRARERCFAADPEAVSRHALAFVQAHHEQGVLCCAKHFPGHGSAAGDTHAGFVDVTATWSERELVPFQRLVEAGSCSAVMSAHVFNAKLDPEYPATLSQAVLTGLLRERLGFEGLIVSDDMQMGAITQRYGLQQAVERAVAAGVDMLCFGNNLQFDAGIAGKVVDILERAVAEGRLARSRIDASCARVLALKALLHPG